MRVLFAVLFAVAAMSVAPQAADARDGCGPGYYYNGYRCRPMDGGYGPGYRRRYEEPYYNRYYYGYRRPPTKWEQKGFCPPGQAKKGNC
jgi:hypothetical protein